MTEADEGLQSEEHVLAAVDSSPHSLAALQAAARLAALLGQTLDAFFVEDIDLLRLAALPFTREVGSFTATTRLLDSPTVERELRMAAERSRRAVDEAATASKVAWGFRVVRGSVADEVSEAARHAAFVSVGRTGRSRRYPIGSVTQRLLSQGSRPLLVAAGRSTLESPVVVVDTGSEASQRALRLASQLSQRAELPLELLVLVLGPPVAGAEERLRHALGTLRTRSTAMQVPDADVLPSLLQRLHVGVLILPRERAELLTRTDAMVFVVP